MINRIHIALFAGLVATATPAAAGLEIGCGNDFFLPGHKRAPDRIEAFSRPPLDQPAVHEI